MPDSQYKLHIVTQIRLAGGSVVDGLRQAGSGMARSRARARLNLLLPGPALGKMQGQSACRAGDPSGQGKDPSSEDLGGHDLLTQATAPPDPGQRCTFEAIPQVHRRRPSPPAQLHIDPSAGPAVDLRSDLPGPRRPARSTASKLPSAGPIRRTGPKLSVPTSLPPVGVGIGQAWGRA